MFGFTKDTRISTLGGIVVGMVSRGGMAIAWQWNQHPDYRPEVMFVRFPTTRYTEKKHGTQG